MPVPTSGSLWADVHGLVLGAVFLLAYSGGLAGLFTLRTRWETATGLRVLARQLIAGTWIMALVAWLTVVTGTYVVYPLYRSEFRSVLATSFWNTFSMAWKIHIGWFAPILATTVAYVVTRYRTQLAEEPRMRQAMVVLFPFAFVTAGVAGLLGALTNKVLPVY
jgi:hypothetical protein